MGILDGRVALVTGAGQGVGEGIALALAGEGARVMAAGRTLAKVKGAAEKIARRGGTAQAVACDVKSESDIRACVDATVDAFGGLDILVNNAQEVPLGPMTGLRREDVEAGWLSGPLAAFSFMQAAHPHLKKGKGCVINLATSAALRPDPFGYGAYAAVKEAMRAMSRAAAYAWGPEAARALAGLRRVGALAPRGGGGLRRDGAAALRRRVRAGHRPRRGLPRGPRRPLHHGQHPRRRRRAGIPALGPGSLLHVTSRVLV